MNILYKKISVIAIAIFTMLQPAFSQCISNNALYVSPDGNGNGSASNPTNLEDALIIINNSSSKTHVVMSGGDYYLYQTITLPSNINIEGGFRQNGSTWVKDPFFTTKLNIIPRVTYYTFKDYWTNVSGTYQVQDYEVANVIGLQLDSVQNVFLKDFKINVWSNSGSNLSSRDGYSIYGIHAYKATNVTLMGLNITTGNAQNGGFGVPGRNGYSAIYNVAGGLEIDYNLTTDLSKPVFKVRPESSTYAAGGYGGYGGPLQRFVACHSVGCLQLGCELGPATKGQTGGKSGGEGGVCGDACSLDCYFETYSNYLNAAQQFASVVSNVVPAPTLPDPSGRGGANGYDGIDGKTYTASRNYYEYERYFIPGTGITGQSGLGGSGGGGGGAGGIRTLRIPGPPPGAGDVVSIPVKVMQATLLAVNLIGTAAGVDICGAEVLNMSTVGGYGGGGGEGGEGGGGGGGGGAVYGIFTKQCNNVSAGNITYDLGDAGTGGQGGYGGGGGSGALGSDGPDVYPPLLPISNRGAQGGRGGNGGSGGDGQNGKAGVKREMWRVDDNLAFGIDTSRLCTNSIIGITKHPQANITVFYQPPGSNIGTGQSFITKTPTYVEFSIPATGKALVRITSTLNGTIKAVDYDITKQRAAPDFYLPLKTCSYDTMQLTASDTTLEGYYWRIYLNGNLVKESRDKSFKFVPSVRTGNPLYRVYLQTYENCCGWSVPTEKATFIEAPLNLSIAYWNVYPYPFCEGSDSMRLDVSGSPSFASGTPPFTVYYPGLKWNTGDSLTNKTFAKTNGNYFATYTSDAGCVTKSPIYKVTNIKPRPTSVPTTQTAMGACDYTPISIYPTSGGDAWSYNFYSSPTDPSPLPNGYKTNQYTFTPFFGLGSQLKDSIIVYTASVSYEGCVGTQRGTAVIYHEKFPPYVKQPFTNYYYSESAANDCGAYVTYQVPEGMDYCSPFVNVTRISGLASGAKFPEGISTVVHKLTDGFGNETLATTTIEVRDKRAPVINLVSPNINITTAPGTCSGKWNLLMPTATDNCSGTVTVNKLWSGLNTGDTLFGVGTTKLYYSAEDASGNVANATTEIKVSDTQPPLLTCPANQTYYVKGTDTTAHVFYNQPTATDNCTQGYLPVSFVSGFGYFGEHPLGSTTEVYEATDLYGNTGTCSFNVTVTDSIRPVINCPKSVYFVADSNKSYTTIFYATPTATDNLSGIISIAKLSGKASGDTASAGTHTAIWKATDVYGNIGTCAVEIMVADRQAPNLVCPSSKTVGVDNGSCNAVVNYTVAPALDNDGNFYTPYLFTGLSSGSSFSVGTHQVAYMVADAQSNKAYCSFDITVKDTIAPVFTTPCPNSITLNINPLTCMAFSPLPVLTGTDNSCASPQINIVAGSFSGHYEMGTTIQKYMIKDFAGNTNFCTYSVTVVDNNTLAITCPQNITRNADAGDCFAYIPYFGSPIVAPDYNCKTITYSSPFAPNFPVGTTQITYTVNANNQQASCAFNVTIIDNQKPDIVSPANIIEHITAGNCGKVLNFAAPIGTDNCTNGLGTFRIEGLASGSVFPIGTTVQTYVVSDLAGHTDTARFTITILDTVKPTIAAHANEISSTSDMCGKVMTFTEPVGTDNSSCAVTTKVAGLNPGELFPLGTTKQIYVITDGAGNSDTCSFDVIVNPIYPLQAACMSHWLQSDPIGYGAIVYYPVPGTVDQQTGQLNACPGIHIILEEGRGSGAFFPPGSSIEKYAFVIKGTGDTVRCSTNVVVTEFVPPTIDCGINSSLDLIVDSGLCTKTITIPVPDVNDGPNGGAITLLHEIDGAPDTNKVVTFSAGFHTIDYRAVDYSGNSSYCSINLRVHDDVQIGKFFSMPTMVCENDNAVLDPLITGSATGVTYAWRTTDSLGNYVVISTDSVLQFNPAKMGDRKQYSFTLTDRCGASIMGGETLLDVIQAAPATIGGLVSNYCYYDSSNKVITVSPTGGILGGRGVVGNLFNPKKAGIGVHDIEYRFFDTNSGCVSVNTFTVTVRDTPTISLFADSVYCINSAVIQLPSNNSSYIGTGISGTTFNPAIAGGGNHLVTRTVSEFGCSSKLAQNIRVNTVIPSATISATSPICQSSGLYLLTAATTGGIWTGNNVEVDSTTGIARFNSLTSGSGVDTVVYTITKSACSATASKLITVNTNDYNLPYTFPEFCTNSPAVQFDTTDQKRYEGLGFSSTGLFTPANVGMRGPIFYAVVTTNNFACKDTNFRMLHIRGGQLNVYPQQYVCKRGDTVLVNLRSEYDSIRWWNGSNSSIIALTDTGQFTVYLLDTMGCSGSDTMRVNLYEIPAQIVANTSVYACPADSGLIVADSTFKKYLWSTGDTSSSIKVVPGNYSVTVTAAWGCTYSSQTINVNSGADNVLPSITCPSDTVLYTPEGVCQLSGALIGLATAADNCGIATLSNNAPAAFNTGNTNVTWTAKDPSNNQKTCVQIVTVLDTIQPYFTGVPNVGLFEDSTQGNCSTKLPNLLGLFAASDSCSGVTLTQNPPAGTFVTTAYTPIAVTALDLSGNTTTYYVYYLAKDTTKPVLNCPAGITATTSGTTAAVSYSVPTQGTNCSNVSITRIAGLASGANFPLGVTTVSYEIVDGAGAKDTCSFNVTVNQINSVDEITGLNALSAMPVPIIDVLNIVYTNNVTHSLQLKLFNVSGQLIYNDEVKQFDGSYKKQIDLSRQAAGTYFLEVITDNEVLSRKVVKQ